jgi:hypothetical protein
LGLVVKNGSKTRSRTSLVMPVPVSLTLSWAYLPGVVGRRLAAESRAIAG